jgi:hypothetical protein
MFSHTILPSITTHNRTASTWRDKLLEVQQLKLSSVALFLTGVRSEERHELYRELRRAQTKHHFTIPFVHAVSDMRDDEYRLLIDTHGTQTFNLHPSRQFPLQHELSLATRQRITIENAFIDRSLEPYDLEGFSGLCLDIAHAEDLRRTHPAEFEKLAELVKTFPVYANHISIVSDTRILDSEGNMTFHTHVLTEGGDTSYLTRYSADFFGSFVAIELADTIADQLQLVPTIRAILEAKTRSISREAA